MGIIKNAGGVGLWLGTFQFDIEHCVNHISLSPNVPVPINQILACAYAEYGTFEISDIADYALLGRRRKYLVEEESPIGRGVGKSYGSIEMLIETTKYPLTHWVRDIAGKHPDVDVQLDYMNSTNNDFGRVLIQGGRMIETHMNPIPEHFIPLGME